MKATAQFEYCGPSEATCRHWRRDLFVTRAVVALALLALLLIALPAHAQRAFSPRFHATVPGDIVMIGNVTENCAGYADTPSADCAATRTHTSPNGGKNNNDFDMQYTQVVTSGVDNNNSSATLEIPDGATVLFAALYWSSVRLMSDPARSYVSVRTPDSTSYRRVDAVTVDVIDQTSSFRRAYQSVADVTDLVAAAPNGVYSVGNIPGLTTQDNTWGGWTLVVAYSKPGLPLRDLALFDGWQYAGSTDPLDVHVSGFTTPLSGPVNSRLGVLAWDGDRNEFDGGVGGLQFGPDTGSLSTVFNAANPAQNFWNSTISTDGELVDTGMTPNYFNTLGMDLDVLVPAVQLPNGATSAVARLRGTTNETIFIGMVSLVNDAYLPSLGDRLKTSDVEDASGKLYPGGVLTYTIGATNTGTANATNTLVSDDIPVGTTYVPGSLRILTSGGATGDMSDAAGDDQAEYDSINKRVVFRVGAGAGAGATQGGVIAPGASLQVGFKVRVDDDTDVGTLVSNQAQYDYFAEQLQTSMHDQSDSDPLTSGNQPTVDEVVGHDADLAITKAASVNSVGNGGSVEYTIVVSNNGPEAGDNAVVRDPAVANIDCAASVLSCTASSGADCPADPTVAKLQAPPGLVIPTLPTGGSVTLRMTCTLAQP